MTEVRTGSSLAAENLTFSYDGHTQIVNGWSHEFAAGAMHALTGPSGRGKSTVLYLLGLMLRPQNGHIHVDGGRTTGLSDAMLSRLRAESFGFVFQDAALDANRSVLDNVTESALYRGATRRSVENRARVLLADFGVQVAADRRPGEVSGGQAQRIALCRALLHDPPVVLADEPTGNLDSNTEDLVVSALRAHAARGATVVIVTHSTRVADRCHHQVSL